MENGKVGTVSQLDPTLARDLPDALRVLARAGVSGVVHVEGSGGRAQLTIAKGKILFATSNRTRPLGRVLVDKGILTQETLRGVLKLQQGRANARPLGTILYELGLLTGRVADEEISLHIASVVQEAISWETGSFTFEEEPISTAGVLASTHLDVHRILLQVQLLGHA